MCPASPDGSHPAPGMTPSAQGKLMPQPTQTMQTSYERDGYDGTRAGVQWWFEAWGSGSKDQWRVRSDVGRPPTPDELARADYIVFAFRKGRHITYKTRVGGLDL